MVDWVDAEPAPNASRAHTCHRRGCHLLLKRGVLQERCSRCSVRVCAGVCTLLKNHQLRFILSGLAACCVIALHSDVVHRAHTTRAHVNTRASWCFAHITDRMHPPSMRCWHQADECARWSKFAVRHPDFAIALLLPRVDHQLGAKAAKGSHVRAGGSSDTRIVGAYHAISKHMCEPKHKNLPRGPLGHW